MVEELVPCKVVRKARLAEVLDVHGICTPDLQVPPWPRRLDTSVKSIRLAWKENTHALTQGALTQGALTQGALT